MVVNGCFVNISLKDKKVLACVVVKQLVFYFEKNALQKQPISSKLVDNWTRLRDISMDDILLIFNTSLEHFYLEKLKNKLLIYKHYFKKIWYII